MLRGDDIQEGKRYVIASNHRSRIDPFAVFGCIPYRAWRRMGRVHFFTANALMNIPVLHWFLAGLGCFPARSHDRYQGGLEFALRRFGPKETMFIFPEGRRALRGEVTAHRGVAVLAQEPGAMVIPVHIEWTRRGIGRSFRIGIGHPLDASQMSAQELLDRIYDLPVS